MKKANTNTTAKVSNRKSNKINNKENEMKTTKTTSTRTRKNKNDNANTANTSALKEGAQVEIDQPVTTKRTTATRKSETTTTATTATKVKIDMPQRFATIENKFGLSPAAMKALEEAFRRQVKVTAYNAKNAADIAVEMYANPCDYVASETEPARYQATSIVYYRCECKSEDAWRMALLKVASYLKLLINKQPTKDEEANALRLVVQRILKGKAAQILSAGWVDGNLQKAMETEVVEYNEGKRLMTVCLAIAVLNNFIDKAIREKMRPTEQRAWMSNFYRHTGLEPNDLTHDEQRTVATLISDCRTKTLEAFMYSIMRTRSITWEGVRAVVTRYNEMIEK